MKDPFLFSEVAEAAAAEEERRKAEEIPWADYVRQVQLYYNEAQERQFRELVSGLAKRYGTENLSDTVLRALQNVNNGIPATIPESSKVFVAATELSFQQAAESNPISNKEWSTLLNAGLSSGLTMQQIADIIQLKYGCKVREVKQFQFQEAIHTLREEGNCAPSAGN